MAPKPPSRARPGPAPPGEWPFLPPGTARQLLLLRWLALLLVVVLHWFDHSAEGVIFSLPRMAAVVIAYNVLLLLLMRLIPWLRRPLRYLALDTVIATLAVALTGGYHSSFFVLYIFITIGAAFYLELVPTVLVTLIIGLIYIGACYVNPAGLDQPYAHYIMAAKLLGLLVVSVLCALLLEQLRREYSETERERALAGRLRALNDLFGRLNTSLDLTQTLQTVAEAPAALLDASLAAIALVDDDRHLHVTAAVGIDPRQLAGWVRTLDDPLVAAAVAAGRPHVVARPAAYLGPVHTDPALRALGRLVLVPLALDDEPLGVITIADHGAALWAPDELAFLEALAQEAALAIRNARLYGREREQVARLQALDKLQDGFVAAVSHELQTPLTCIRTSLDLLQATGGDFTGDQADLLATVAHHTGRLETLVADLLQVTKLEARQVTLATQPTDLRPLIDRVVEALRPLSDPRGLAVRTHLPPAAPLVDVDRHRIEEVLTNILENAIRFSPRDGAVDIHLSEAAGCLRVTIADQGPGIAPEHHRRIFDRFYVVEDGRGKGGVGLGLFIAQGIVALHGGQIWVDSQPGAGSAFTFTLPIPHPEDRP